jgi:hypothetical protein
MTPVRSSTAVGALEICETVHGRRMGRDGGFLGKHRQVVIYERPFIPGKLPATGRVGAEAGLAVGVTTPRI